MAILEGRNRATPDEAASFVDKFEEMEGEIASLRGSFMNACKQVRERQKELLEDAKSQGIPKKVVKSVVKRRVLERKIDAIGEDLEDDDAGYYEDIRKALGGFSETPLGAAAVQREEAGNGVDPIAAAVDKAWNDADPANKPAKPARRRKAAEPAQVPAE